MSDIVDIANDRIEIEMERSLRRALAAGPLNSNGCCHYCGTALLAELLFCNIECRDDYDREAAIRRKQGSG